MTKAELIAVLAKRIAPKKRKELVWASVAQAVSGALPAEKADIVAAIKSGNEAVVGTMIINLVNVKVNAEALTEAEALLANDTLSLAEIERVL